MAIRAMMIILGRLEALGEYRREGIGVGGTGVAVGSIVTCSFMGRSVFK